MSRRSKPIFVLFAVFALVLALAVCVGAEDHGGIKDSGKCGENLTWTLYEDRLLEISGTGEMEDYAQGEAPWNQYRSFVFNLKLNEGLTRIGNFAFENFHLLSNGLIIPDSVVNIGDYAFFWFDPNGSLILGSGVTSVGKYAFYSAWFSGTLDIPKNLTSIGSGAFAGMTEINEITVADGNPAYCSADGILYSADQKDLIQCPGGKTGEVTILQTTEIISNDAFEHCGNVNGKLIIPAGVKSIGTMSFNGMDQLEEIIVEEGNTSYCSFDGILYYSSKKTNKKTLIECPEGKQGEIKIAPTTTRIENHALSYCDGLTGSLTIPDSVTTIGFDAFSGCTGLTGDVIFGSGVTEIGLSAFSGCTGIEKAYFKGDAPSVFGSDWGKPFENYAEGFTIYYLNGKSGWTTPEWNGYPCYPVDKIPGAEAVVPVAGVTLDKTTATLSITVNADGTETAEELTLKATITPENATDMILTWETSDRSVLSIKGVGGAFDEAHFIAKAPGTATVTVKTNDSGHAATCLVTVVRKDVESSNSVKADVTVSIDASDISKVYIDVVIPGKAKVGDGKLIMRNANDDGKIAEYTISELRCYRDEYDEDSNSTKFGFEIDNIKEYIEWYFVSEGDLFVSLEDNTTIVCTSLTKDSKHMGMFDTLGFRNAVKYFNKEYYLDDADKLFLKNSVSEKEWKSIKKTIDNGWGGSCQGFAAIAYLNAKGVLLPEYIKENEKSLWNIFDTTKRIQSIVNTYFMQQKKTSFEAAKAGWLMHNVTDIVEQLEKACSGISASNPLLICLGSSQHALLGYGLETGVYKDIGAEKNTYHNRILIYDCNYPAVMKYLYFDKKTDKWYYSDTQKQILMLTNKKDMIDPIDFSGHLSNPAQEVKAPNSPDVGINYITNTPSTGNIFNYNILVNGELISVKPGMILPDKRMATSFLMQSAYDEDGNELPPTEMTLYLPEDTHDYTIYPTADQSCDFSLMSNDAFTYIEADAAKEIRFEDDGFIEASGVEGAYKLSVTVDDITDSYPWHTTQACGTADGTVSMELAEEGVVLSGTDLSGVTVTVERGDVTDEIRFTTSEDAVLIVPKTDGDTEEVRIMIDTDGDGDYETELSDESAPLPGDVNSDDEVTFLDLITLSRHLAGWSGYEAETLDMDAADVNGDGTVNAADRLFLARMLADWPGYAADR